MEAKNFDPSILFDRKLGKILQESSDPIDRSKKISESYLSEMIRPTLVDPSDFDYQICDGANDGGLDAWGADRYSKKLYLIQCKWYDDPTHTLTQEESSDLYEFVKDRFIPDNRNGLNSAVREFLGRYRAYYTDYKVNLRFITNGRFNAISQEKYRNLPDNFSFNLINKSGLSVQWFRALGEDKLLNNTMVIAINKSSYFEANFTIPSVGDIVAQKLRMIQCSLCAVDLKAAYDRWSRNLLIRNLRYGLGGKINQGIKETAESELRSAFYAFHNGISIVCESLILVNTGSEKLDAHFLVEQYPGLEVEEAQQIISDFHVDNSKVFVVIRNFQIVNGAQSTETLATVPNSKLIDVYVPCKITETISPQIASKIAVYNNSQNAIRPTDLVSNSSEQVFLQNYAAFEIDPPVFYIRKRKQKWTDILRVHTPTPPKNRIIDYPHSYQAFMSFMGNPFDAYSRPGVFINPDRITYAKISDFPNKDLIIMAGLLYSYEKYTHNDSDPEFTSYWSLTAIAVFGHLFRTYYDSSQQSTIEDALLSDNGSSIWREIARKLQTVFKSVLSINFTQVNGREFETLFRGEQRLFDLSLINTVKPQDIYSLVDPNVRKKSLVEMRNAASEAMYTLEYYNVTFAVFVKLFEGAMPKDFDQIIFRCCKNS